MMTILTAALFSAGAVLAAATILATLRAYWPAVAALREVARKAPQVQDVRITTTVIDVRANAAVLRPDFTVRVPRAADTLRAAA